MAKVYLITSGEYSDFTIEHATLDESKAKAFCELHNRVGGYPYYDIWEQELDDFFVGTEDDCRWQYRYRQFPETHKIEFGWAEYCIVADSTNVVMPWQKDGLAATVYLKDRDDKKAEKIAQDLFAEYRAKEQGIA